MGNACHNGGLGGASPGEKQTEAHDDAPIVMPVDHALSKKASEPNFDKSPAEAESNATTSASVEEVAAVKQALFSVGAELQQQQQPVVLEGAPEDGESSEQPMLEETSSLPAGPEQSEEPASACSSLTQKNSTESGDKKKKAAKAAKHEADSEVSEASKDGGPKSAAKTRTRNASHSPRSTKAKSKPKAAPDKNGEVKSAEAKPAERKKESSVPAASNRAPSHDTAASNQAKKDKKDAPPELKRVNSDPLKEHQKTSHAAFADGTSPASAGGHGLSPRLGNRGQAAQGNAAQKRAQVGDAMPHSPARKKGGEVFHVLKVSILSARGLRNADDNFGGTSDPFCVCDIPGKAKSRFQTKVVWQQTEPVWNLEVELSGVSPTDSLRFNVYDKDTFSSKDLLGKVELPHHKFIHNGFSGEVRLLETSGGTAMSVESYLNLQILPLRTFNGEAKTTKCSVKKISEGGYIKTGDKDAPRLVVTLVGARGLRNADWAVNGLSDPYCICEVPGKPFSRILTPVVQDKLDPEWNYTREICDWEPGDSLSFAVFDKDYGKKDDLLGRATLAAERIYPFAFDGEIPLFDQGKQRQGTLIVKVVSDSSAKEEE